jgi:ABC-type branched-subunit amino acid transport system substrate-binding protein
MAYTAVEQLLPRKEYFATGITSTDNYKIQARYIQTVATGKPRVAFFNIDTPAQKVAIGTVTKKVKELGWNVAAQQVYQSGATDVSAQASKIASSKPDYIVTGMLNDIAPTFIKALSTLGVKAPVINFSPGAAAATFKRIASDQFLALGTFSDPTNPELSDDMVSAIKKYGEKDATAAIFTQGWVTGMVYAKAISVCGNDCTGASMTKALQTISGLDIGDLGPALSYDKSHQGADSARVLRYDATKGRPVPISDFLSAAELK